MGIHKAIKPEFKVLLVPLTSENEKPLTYEQKKELDESNANDNANDNDNASDNANDNANDNDNDNDNSNDNSNDNASDNANANDNDNGFLGHSRVSCFSLDSPRP
jgi:hypothetical protein